MVGGGREGRPSNVRAAAAAGSRLAAHGGWPTGCPCHHAERIDTRSTDAFSASLSSRAYAPSSTRARRRPSRLSTRPRAATATSLRPSMPRRRSPVRPHLLPDLLPGLTSETARGARYEWSQGLGLLALGASRGFAADGPLAPSFSSVRWSPSAPRNAWLSSTQ